ncbi:MAG: Smr/MutS family protein, partial [Bacteroidota bacterium]|nr:Smr/MutS family protein [Bacteroidota bacterium]
GFDQIKENIKNFCISSLGEHYVEKLRFSSDHRKIVSWIEQTSELKSILLFDNSFPSQNYYDLSDTFKRIKIPATFIEEEELFELQLSLITIDKIYSFFKEREQYPALKQLSENLKIDKSILKKIEILIDEKGTIRDSASSVLSEIRHQLRKKKSSVNITLRKSLEAVKKDGWAKEDSTPTIRNGRSVIPIPASHKRKVNGFIHDESATGQTVYIEPTEVFQLNNVIRELQSAEHREVIKILTEFTDEFRPNIEDYSVKYIFLGLFDFIRAKARYSILIEAEKPTIQEEPYIYLEEARHPLLYLSHKKQKKSVTPLNLKLDIQERILVITGPNAGGKSVCLKTVGLIQYMLQCGLLIPANTNSKLGVFKDLFINIGDEQSLENDLSTYSSHLFHLKNFIERTRKESLFLIDEFGAGTEPHLGGAIAEAALEELNRKKSFGVITTHYANLKKIADETSGMVNGAMLFDTKKMNPLFILKIGKPGSSFAFEIAEKIGLSKKLLKKAALKSGTTQLDFDKQLAQLELDKREIEKKQIELKVADSFLSDMIDKYENLNKELESSKKSIIKEARTEAREIVSGSNKLIENTIRDIKQAKAEKTETKKIRKKLSNEKERLVNADKKETKKIKKSTSNSKEKISIGSYVKIKGQNNAGKIIEIQKKKATVAFDSFNFTTSINQLEITTPQKENKVNISSTQNYSKFTDALNKKAANFKLSLDVRGNRAEEAINKTMQYIDDSILIGIHEVEIIHGKGDGILRSAIHELLSNTKEVKSFSDQNPDTGGHGVTIVTFL